MAKSGQYVIWKGDELLLQVDSLLIDDIDKVGLQVIAASQPPVDTGFLDASAYIHSTSGLNTFDETWTTGMYVSRKTGKLVNRQKVEAPAPPPRNGAIVGWAADYSIYVEANTDFIYKALQEVAARNR